MIMAVFISNDDESRGEMYSALASFQVDDKSSLLSGQMYPGHHTMALMVEAGRDTAA